MRRAPPLTFEFAEAGLFATNQRLSFSRGFAGWLAEQKCCLAFTAPFEEKLFFIGLRDGQRLSTFEWSFRGSALWAGPQTLYLSGPTHIWRFENCVATDGSHEGYDRIYVPQVGYTTGPVDTHEITLDAAARPIFVNTLYSCLAAVSEQYSFIPLWRPPFISRLAAEDRCHLNGLAIEDGQPKYVTAFATSDEREGWRAARRDGGVVLDVPSGEIVCRGLSLPHSPMFYRGRLWVLNSGTGELGWIAPGVSGFEALTFCPGFLRGLGFCGDYAVVGLSKPRRTAIFAGLRLDETLAHRGEVARCGLYIIDLKRGEVAHSLQLEGDIEEIFGLAVIRDTHMAMTNGFAFADLERTIALPPSASQ